MNAITDIKIPFPSMIVLCIKFMLASLVAAIIVGAALALPLFVLSAMLSGFVSAIG